MFEVPSIHRGDLRRVRHMYQLWRLEMFITSAGDPVSAEQYVHQRIIAIRESLLQEIRVNHIRGVHPEDAEKHKQNVVLRKTTDMLIDEVWLHGQEHLKGVLSRALALQTSVD